MIPAPPIRPVSPPSTALSGETEALSIELKALLARIDSLPEDLGRDLLPLFEEVCDDARFRGRVLAMARAALENLHLELASVRFDLDVTRRERDALRLNRN